MFPLFQASEICSCFTRINPSFPLSQAICNSTIEVKVVYLWKADIFKQDFETTEGWCSL